MKYGAPIYRQCSNCHKAIEIHPLLEGSHSGSVLWSDGHVQSMMMPNQAILAKCSHCNQVMWLPDLLPIEAPDSNQVCSYLELSLEDYFKLLRQPQDIAKERLKVLRTLAWHQGNHVRRGNKEPSPFSQAEMENMRELDALLGEEWENELMMKVEIARELGDFNKAKSLLEDVDFSAQIVHLSDQLKTLVEENNQNVIAFKTRDLEKST